ncbi:MAG: PilN domain-containing protein [Bdellovibrionia bacterium]
MIKVNLAPSLAKGGLGSGVFGSDSGLFVSDETLRKEAAKRILVILLGPLGLFLYEQQIIPEKLATLASVRQTHQSLVAFNASGADIVKRIEKLNATKALFDKRLEAIEALQKNRFREVRILDVVQSSIPETAWLREVNMQRDRILINGFSMSDAETTRFLDDLSRSSHIKEVRLLRTVEETIESNSVKRFEIECIFDVPRTDS